MPGAESVWLECLWRPLASVCLESHGESLPEAMVAAVEKPEAEQFAFIPEEQRGAVVAEAGAVHRWSHHL